MENRLYSIYEVGNHGGDDIRRIEQNFILLFKEINV